MKSRSRDGWATKGLFKTIYAPGFCRWWPASLQATGVFFVAVTVFTTGSVLAFLWSSCFQLFCPCAGIQNYNISLAERYSASLTLQGVCCCIPDIDQNYFCHWSSHFELFPNHFSRWSLRCELFCTALLFNIISVVDHLQLRAVILLSYSLGWSLHSELFNPRC